MLGWKVGPPDSRGSVRFRNAQVIGVTLALLVGVLAVAAPWCVVSWCPEMTVTVRTAAGVASCPTDPGHRLTPECRDMRPAADPATAAVASKAPVVPDLFAVAAAGVRVPAVSAVRAAYSPPLDEPPRLVLDTSRLRI